MTNAEAINVLRGQEMAYWDTLSEAEHKAFDKAVEALERTRWRDAKTEPPELDTNVIAYARGKNDPIYRIIIASMSDSNLFDVHIKTKPYWREPWQFFDTMYEITHWMPLPELPKEEL